MSLKECYSMMGGNYEDVLARFRNEALIQKFVLKFLKDPTFAALCSSIEAENQEEAFRAAHTLKGVCQNLGFTRLYESSSKLTEALRNGQCVNAADLMHIVDADYRQTISAIETIC